MTANGDGEIYRARRRARTGMGAGCAGASATTMRRAATEPLIRTTAVRTAVCEAKLIAPIRRVSATKMMLARRATIRVMGKPPKSVRPTPRGIFRSGRDALRTQDRIGARTRQACEVRFAQAHKVLLP